MVVKILEKKRYHIAGLQRLFQKRFLADPPYLFFFLSWGLQGGLERLVRLEGMGGWERESVQSLVAPPFSEGCCIFLLDGFV